MLRGDKGGEMYPQERLAFSLGKKYNCGKCSGINGIRMEFARAKFKNFKEEP